VWEIEVPERGEWRRCSQDEDEALRRLLVRGDVDLIESPTTETIESVCTHPATSSAATEKERDGESDQHSVERSTRANDEILREPQVEPEMPLESSAATEKERDGESDQHSVDRSRFAYFCSSEGDERLETEFGCVAQDEDDDHYENTRANDANDEILREPQIEPEMPLENWIVVEIHGEDAKVEINCSLEKECALADQLGFRKQLVDQTWKFASDGQGTFTITRASRSEDQSDIWFLGDVKCKDTGERTGIRLREQEFWHEVRSVGITPPWPRACSVS
jgi:hypothetical protein